MKRRDFIKNIGKIGLVIALSPYLKACATYEYIPYPLPQKSGVVLQRPIDGLIDTEATKNLFLENTKIYEPNELIFDIVNESYFSFFNSEIPEILTVDYDTKEEMKNALGYIPPAYYERITKTIHLLQNMDFPIQNISRLFHELGHYYEHTHGNEDKNEHLSETIEFALGLEFLLQFPEITEIQPPHTESHPFLDNLKEYTWVHKYDYNKLYNLDPGYGSYIIGATTNILYLNKNKGDLYKTIDDIFKTSTSALDKNAVEFLKQDFKIRENFNKETFSLLIQNIIDPRIPYDKQNNEYFNNIIKTIGYWISTSDNYLQEDYFDKFLR